MVSQNYDAASFPWRTRPLAWYEVWLIAITRPTVKSFQELVMGSGATPGRAYGWVFSTALISSLLLMLATGLRIGRSWLNITTVSQRTETYRVDLSLVDGPLIAAVVILLAFMLLVSSLHLASYALGGIGEHAMLAYAMAAYTVPLTWLSGLVFLGAFFLGRMPLDRALLLPLALALYALLLNLVAIKAVHGFGWIKALASMLIGYGLIVALVTLLTRVLPWLVG